MDQIVVSKLRVETISGIDAWERIKKQPILLTVTLYTDIRKSGEKDTLGLSVSYADVAKRVKTFAEKSEYRSMETLAWYIVKLCLDVYASIDNVSVTLMKPKGLLHAKYSGVSITRNRDQLECVIDTPLSIYPYDGDDIIFVRDLNLHAVVGVNPWEREEKQIVVVNIDIHTSLSALGLKRDRVSAYLNYKTIARAVSSLVESSAFLTMEALITCIAQLLIRDMKLPRVRIAVEKPSALMFADAARVEIVRSRADFDVLDAPASVFDNSQHNVYIAFGTNLGDRLKNIHDALDECEKLGIDIADTSFLYESSPMYITDQPLFLNGVFRAMTRHSPLDLLSVLKSIEEHLGRDFATIRNGPRTIDLDIIFYGDLVLDTEILTIPHKLMHERTFVLKPLSDIAPDLEHPKLLRTCSTLNALQRHKDDGTYQVNRVTPISDTLLQWEQPHTIIMGILNVTPDSFSDGGRYESGEEALRKVTEMVRDGADIIDIGGQSTRPDAEYISCEEEIRRVVPIIKLIRASADERIARIPISIDTFRVDVAREAIMAGSSMINDVTGGEFGGVEMMNVWRESRLPVCVMHMRGDSKTMTKLTNYADNDVIKEVREVLGARVNDMIALGIRRWNIIVDPGVGFAKDTDQNFQMLKNLPLLVKDRGECSRLPLLVGVSRKGFIGKAVGDADPKGDARKWGTAGACVAAISGGCNILRVHDVKEMRSVIAVADKCFRL